MLAAAGAASLASVARSASSSQSDTIDRTPNNEILGQGAFRYRAQRNWGQLDHARYPVKDCHGIAEDHSGRIVMLTNETRNNLIAYSKAGKLISAWEMRFPAAHGLEITHHGGEERYWITDHDRQVISMCAPTGRELRLTGPDALRSKYPDPSKYKPTNVSILPDGDFFVSDGYGASFVHHFDPDGRYVSSFGGEGEGPENLQQPHAVWIDMRSGEPALLVCDRGHAMLKWFSLSGELMRVVPVPGAMPCNVARFSGRYKDHLAIASLNGMILILDSADRVVSVVGGDSARYVDGRLQPLSVFNYSLTHPHDICVDEAHAIYVAQWFSNNTYPVRLNLI
jgi:hypothetical protein